ncbi:MAG: alpha/beta hydrolase-fold protein [Chloroflexota bacterium]|nr:alpha/beta hydrolase-fold protein [Chloroflexota bacterium]
MGTAIKVALLEYPGVVVTSAPVHLSEYVSDIEHACSNATIGLLMSTVLPLAREHLNLVDIDQHPGAFGVAGASMGGLLAIYTGMRLPDIFGKVISQSGAFALQTLQRESVVYDLIRHDPVRRIDIHLGVGTMEWLLSANRRMHALLRERGYAVTYREFCAGHNYTAWRNDIWHGLERLWGGDTLDERERVTCVPHLAE